MIHRCWCASVARDQGGRFIAGVSGNAGGRPKVVGLVREAAQRLCPQAIEELARLMLQSDDDRVRVAAARELLDRGIGRAEKASQEAAGNSLAAALEAIRRNAEAQAGHAAKLVEGTVA